MDNYTRPVPSRTGRDAVDTTAYVARIRDIIALEYPEYANLNSLRTARRFVNSLFQMCDRE